MTRHVPLPLGRHVVSGPGQLDFRWERFSAISRELPALFKQHWQEIALDRGAVPLAPDWDAYFAADLAGILHFMTVRHRGELVGYVSNMVGGHQHYVTTKFAHTEMFWLHPHFRKGWQPVKMLIENMRGLKEREVVVHTVNFKLNFMDGRVGKLWQRLGYMPTDIVMRKVL